MTSKLYNFGPNNSVTSKLYNFGPNISVTSKLYNFGPNISVTSIGNSSSLYRKSLFLSLSH